MVSFGDRIKEERKRLGITQEDVAQLTKITIKSQQNYESGKRTPDIEYLDALDKAEFDSHYILTGERSCDPTLLGISKTDRMKAVLDMAIEVMQEVETERGVEFSAENLQNLMAYAYTYCTSKKALKAYVDSVFLLAQNLPAAKPPEDQEQDGHASNKEKDDFNPDDCLDLGDNK